MEHHVFVCLFIYMARAACELTQVAMHSVNCTDVVAVGVVYKRLDGRPTD